MPRSNLKQVNQVGKLICIVKVTSATELDRYRNEDGGISLSVDHYAYVDWDQGASGKI